MMNQHPTLPNGTYIGNLQIVNVLGVGAYGKVYLARDEQKRLFAVKSLRQVRLDDRQRAFQRTEIGLHSRISGHPNIIRLERVIREPEWTHVVLEYCPEGDLFTAITQDNLYLGNHHLIRKVFLQLLEAVSYCHDKGVYHRDLKPENVLVFDRGHTVKLADFGLATTEAITDDYGCGSTFYFSPECQGDVANKAYRIGYATAPNDVWALGVILINLAAGRNPWRQASLNDETFCAYLADPNFLLKILPISRELNQILKRIFCIDPLRRIGLDELKQRIKNCKYFTRTPQVERWERAQEARQEYLAVSKRVKQTRITLPPSPPTTPHSDRSLSTLDMQALNPMTPPSSLDAVKDTNALVSDLSDLII